MSQDKPTSWEATFAASLGIIGCVLGACALVMARDGETGGPRLLIYDNAEIAVQAEAFTQAGQNPIIVIDEAVSRAVASGAIVVDRAGIKGPVSAHLRLAEFVEVGGDVGRGPERPVPSGSSDRISPEDLSAMLERPGPAGDAMPIGLAQGGGRP